MALTRFAGRASAAGSTLIVAVVSGLLFSAIELPIPWLLGPMIGVCVFARTVRTVKLIWPGSVRNAGLIIVGYAIGIVFTRDTLTEIARQLPAMVLMTTLLLALCALIAYVVSRFARIPYPTALTGNIPGGLTQMVALAEETRGIDMTIVTFLQTSRLMMIVVFVPLLIFSPWLDRGDADAAVAGIHSAAAPDVARWSELLPDILPYAVLCTGLALLASKIKFPTAYLLAPLIAAAGLHLTGLTAPELPPVILGAAQLMIGCYVGLLLRPENLPNKVRLIAASIVSGIVLLAGACGLSYLLTRLHAMSTPTSLLALAPGGMDQMGIIAHAIGADLSIVTCYQLFRTFFIFLAVPPLLKLLFRYLERRRADRQPLVSPK